MSSYEEQKKIILDYINKRRTKYDLFIQEFQKEINDTNPAARGNLFRFANLILDELRTDNDLGKNLLEASFKTTENITSIFDALMLYNAAIRYTLEKLDSIHVQGKDQSELYEIKKRLIRVETETQKYKPTFEEIEKAANEIRQAQSKKQPEKPTDYIQ